MSSLVSTMFDDILLWFVVIMIYRVDVIEYGKTSFAERQEPWHLGYSLCAAPSCALDDKMISMNTIFKEEWSYLREGNEIYTSSELSIDGKENVILHKMGQGIQILFSGGGSCTGECFTRLMITNTIKLARRTTLFSIGFDNVDSVKSLHEKSIDILERFHAALRSYDASKANVIAPCVFHTELGVQKDALSPDESSFNESTLFLRYGHHGDNVFIDLLKQLDEQLSQLGYISLTSNHDDSLQSYHILRSGCDVQIFDRVKHFLPDSIYKRAVVSSNNKYFESAGNTMKCKHHGAEFQAIDNSLHPHVLEALRDKINEISVSIAGSRSYFIPFGDSVQNTLRRTLIEEIIVTQLAPLVLGDVDEAIRDGYLGAEWWIQSRPSNTPKEYHLDTAITWCRDNGWPAELLTACHFYPTVGSIFYLSSQGGPTVVFNQSMSSNGMNPMLPKELSLIYPKENRLLMFKGNKFHGVLKDGDGDVSSRDTLLVNYWRDKTAGEKETPTTIRDAMLVEEFRDEMKGPHHLQYQQHRPVRKGYRIHQLDRDFKEDLWKWKSQEIPNEYHERIKIDKLEGYNDGFHLFKLRTTDVMKDTDPNGTYQNWHHWEVDESSRNIGIIQLPSDKEWRKSMPGGNPFENQTYC